MPLPDLDLEELNQQLGVEPLPQRRRVLLPISELLDSATAPEFVIGGIIERDSIGVFFGPWGCGKTLIAFDLCLSVVLGKSIHGRPVRQGPIVYLAGEGRGGLARRFVAWAVARQATLNDAAVVVSDGAVALLNADAASELEAEIRELSDEWGSEPALIVVDTVSRAFAGGNENASEDMGRFVDAVDCHLRRPFRAGVLLVHHTGHEARDRGRGSSVLPAAADVEYRVERPEEDVIRIVCTKSRDFAPPPPLSWRIVPVPLVLDGENVDSVTVEALGDYSPPADAKVSVRQASMLELLRELLAANREKLKAGGYDPEGARVTANEWKKAGAEKGHTSGHRNTFYKVRDALRGKHLIAVDGPYVVPMELPE